MCAIATLMTSTVTAAIEMILDLLTEDVILKKEAPVNRYLFNREGKP